MRDANDYILLQHFDLNKDDKGGFFWWVHQVACLLHLCELTKKRAVVMLDDGYYNDKQHRKPSWWSHYFKYPLFNKAEQRLVRESRHVEVTSSVLYPIPKNSMYKYTRTTFERVMRNRMSADVLANVYRRYIVLQPRLSEYIDKVARPIVEFKGMTLGIHYRGSDKFYSNGDKEDMVENAHAPYTVIYNRGMQELAKHQGSKLVFIASDESDFVDGASKFFNERGITVVKHNSFRSSVNTSGVRMPENVSTGPGNSHEIIQSSIHRGHKNISGIRKGRDAVADVLLLSKCDVYLKSQNGNFAAQPERFNPSIISI